MLKHLRASTSPVFEGLRGFALPGFAAAAARKNHELGTAHQFTKANAREHGLKGGRPRAHDRRKRRRPDSPGRRTEDR